MFFKLFVILAVNKLSLQQEEKCVNQPCNVQGDSMKFIIVGDWGGNDKFPFTTKIQLKVAESMNRMAIKENVQFYIDTGDHFYPNGVQNVNDSRFQTSFEDIFDKPGHQKLWHLIFGNHDYYANVTAQNVYSQKSWRWNFPSPYYSVSYHLNSSPMVDFIMMDTIILCGNNRETKDEQPPGPTNPRLAEEQWKWIEKLLSASKAPYLFLVGHYPPRSTGSHGPKISYLYDRVERLMEKYQVTAYLTGHDHNLEYYRYWLDSGTVLHYILSGFGAKSHVERIDSDNLKGESVFFYPNIHKEKQADIEKDSEKGGYVLATLTNSSASFQFYNGDSQSLYMFNVQPRIDL